MKKQPTKTLALRDSKPKTSLTRGVRKSALFQLLFSLMTPVWLAVQRKKQEPEAQAVVTPPPLVEQDFELEILNAKCGHDDRTIPLDPGCPKCRKLLQPVDFEAIARSQALMAAGPQPLPPSATARRAFAIAPVPDAPVAGLTDEELAVAVWVNDPQRPALGLSRPLAPRPRDPDTLPVPPRKKPVDAQEKK